VLEFIDVSFGENHLKTLVFMRVNMSVFMKTLSINSSTVRSKRAEKGEMCGMGSNYITPPGEGEGV